MPGGTVLKTLNNGTIVEVYPQFQVIGGITWIHVIVNLNGERLEGWMLESTINYATPEPNFGTPSGVTVTSTP